METFFELQPLRIQGGWKIEYNNFTEYDLEKHDGDSAFEYLTEDLLQLFFCSPSESRNDLTIDLGWYPAGSLSGSYTLSMVKNFNWAAPVEKLVTRSKADVVRALEKWVCYDFFSKFL